MSTNWAVDVAGGIVRYPALEPGRTSRGGGSFTVCSRAATVPGMPLSMSLALEFDGGFIDTLRFELRGPEPRGDAPFGPDEHGYYCFDDTDEDFDQAPEFIWIEISPNAADPELEGEGV